MDKETNDTHPFSADDIRRYHSGEMSVQEMYAMEKASLEDPFLADAMEGYTYTATANKDLEELISRLQVKERDKKIIPHPRIKSIYRPLQVAAFVLLLAGAGWTIYQVSRPKENDMALNKPGSKESDNIPSQAPSIKTDSNTSVFSVQENDSNLITTGKKRPNKTGVPHQPPPGSEIKKEEQVSDQGTADVANVRNKNTISTSAEGNSAAPRMSTVESRERSTVFQGRIVNTENKPVPYANINIPESRKDVLTDAQGFFSIATPDSTLKLNVSAAGYQTNRLNLNNPQESHRVVMHESEQPLQEGNTAKPGKKEKAKQPAKILNDLEPVDGIEKYNEYLVLNIKKPKDLSKQTVKGEVGLLFDVSDNGQPVNIIVEKPLCPSCDDEAIRLLKEGPAWQKKPGKKGRIIIIF